MKYLLFLVAIIIFVGGCDWVTVEKEFTPAGKYVPPGAKEDITYIVIAQDLKLEDESHISFKLLNLYNVSRECWAQLEITDNDTMIDSVKEYVGVIEAGESMGGVIEFRMPIGTVSLDVVPQCKDVEYEQYQD